MCGIFGLLNNDPDKITNKDAVYMSDKGKPRGPESSNAYFSQNNKVMLGFHRLAINGLDPESDQPLCIHGCRLICNGEIYNYKSLYKQLNRTPFTRSDCEIIIHMYREYGIDYTLQSLDGVFAFILYDEDFNKVFVARDPYGVRPIFECIAVTKNQNDVIGYGSELKQLHPMKVIFDKVEIHQFTPGSYKQYDFSFFGALNRVTFV